MILRKPTYDKLLHLPQISYGRIYNWWAAAHANIAPVGYSVPTDEQWTILTDYITAEIAAERLPDVGVGNILKSQRQSGAIGDPIIPTTTHPYWAADATDYGRDSVKFSALPGGTRAAGDELRLKISRDITKEVSGVVLDTLDAPVKLYKIEIEWS